MYMRKIWNIRSADSALCKQLADSLTISPALAQVLVNRGITTPEQADTYLNAGLESCHDPRLLKGMDRAIDRIRRAIAIGERIVVYGDYDVDGLTSTALLHYVLSELGAVVQCYIPHRVDEGYGLNLSACQTLRKSHARLVITVDCGISSFAEVEALRGFGIDTVVTDHHQPVKGKIPPAFAVINPYQPGCSYPYKSLAGVGLAYKLAVALTEDEARVRKHLDLVALGTVSDVAPLSGENRILVKYGLQTLSRAEKPGLKALIDVAGIRTDRLTAEHVGFILGPRINATGRMGSAEQALQLLLSVDYAAALPLAQALDSENRERQKVESKTLREAMAIIDREINFKEHRALVLHHDTWHPGVIGIVASRLAERYYRPTVLISTAEEVAKGSCRSIRNFHIFNALSQCSHLLEDFGGHEKAAGLSIRRDNLAGFKELFNSMAVETLSPDDLVPVIDIDKELSFSLLTEELLNDIERCAPFGMANPRPVFVSHAVSRKGPVRPMRGNGNAFWVSDGTVTCEALVNNRGEELDLSGLTGNFSLVYAPSLRERHGINSIQLKVKDIQF